MMTMNKVMLWLVAAMAVAFLFFPQQIMGLVMPSTNQTITDDMTQTVVQVEGMT
jgi:hypothetical protein